MNSVKKERDTYLFIILAIFLGNFLAFINSGTVNVAIPSIMRELHSNLNSVQWIVTGFMLAIGTIAPVVGYLGNKFGYKQLYVFALIGLTVSSALCGLAENIVTLIIFRILQGICSGLIQISTMTIIYQSVKKEKQAMAISLWTISIMVAPAIGPTLGGLLTNAFGWKALFFSCVPVGIIATLCAIFFIPSSKKGSTVSLDIVGLITVVIGNVSLLMYFTKGSELGWFSVSAIALLLVGIMGIVIFIWRELTAKEPLLNISVLKYPKFMIGTLLNCLISIGLYSSVYLIPLFMEEALGASSFMSGLVMLPGALSMIVVTMIIGKLNNKFDLAWFVIVGAILLSIATWEFSQLNMNSSVLSIILIMIVRYVGVGFATSPITNISMSVIPPEQIGHATSIANWLRQAVAALSIAVFSSILAVRTQTHISELKGEKIGEALKQGAFLLASNDTFFVAFVILVLSIPLSFLMLNRKQSIEHKTNP
ncbi:DHA2 family efflux MFS transporter permease subunit [Rummeliibacillus sp. NPDC094406]|uniref:DHA2 family efflux MFS transporter permease subunit n=1 Tax=Rummeliibacillus sp. NPDC094406 TaxID=3364511 RepID=UPI00382E75B8